MPVSLSKITAWSLMRHSVACSFIGLAALASGTAQTPSMTAPEQHTMESPGRPQAVLAEFLTVTVGGVSRQYRVEDLSRMPQVSVSVQNGHTKQREEYTGVLVRDLLQAAGLGEAAAGSHLLLRSYLRAQGTDFYFVIYSGTELDSGWHEGKVLVATKRNGQPLGVDGRFQLISTEDQRPARWVRNLNQLVLTPLN